MSGLILDKNNKNQHTTPPTMHDVAKVAGVSQMTVSRVMRGSGYISADVLSRVEDAAKSIGYVHNRLAGGMAKYDNPLVGVVVPTLQNRVFTEVLSGISNTLDKNNLRPVFGVSEYSLKREEKIVYDLLSWRPQGLILAGLEHTDGLRRIIKQTGVRTAEIMDVDGPTLSGSFGISQEEAGENMAAHLLSKGYRRFGYIAGLHGTDFRAEKRFNSFKTYILDNGGTITQTRISDKALSMQDGRSLTAEILAQTQAPESIYYSNDDLAAGGLMHCLANGLSVPNDVALAGFNGLNFLEALPLQITTTKTPRYDIGVEAANWIANKQSNKNELLQHKFDTELIIGQTT
ncbi:LacI family DNA-binding transcriptional regulator [Lentilitoribacter sp. Alg239-R112]|uniref:LacI family DNA-binding transcriptional regulator n=1 Tax=Lentilitoribacter sp. Alg239-R112 TaxID=2305987 RepID=UPI0013A7013D|nr:LacI family DNA-binding transcriptional regulator [Lentilitoribacter sp. Alg239-R112]